MADVIHIIRERYGDGSVQSLCGLRGRHVGDLTHVVGRVRFLAVPADDHFQGGTCLHCRRTAAAIRHKPGPGREPASKKRRRLAA